MLTALAPSGPVAQSVPTSPPSTTDSTQSARRESFQDVYRNVPTDDESHSDAAPQQKTTASTVTKSKKSSTGDGNDKTDVTATPTPRPLVLQRIPLVFALPSLGHDVSQQPAPDQLAPDQSANVTENPAQPSMQPGGNDVAFEAPPGINLPLPKPGPIAPLPLVPVDEKLAFSARLTQPNAQPAPVQATRTSIPPASRTQTSEEPRTPAELAAVSSGKDANQAGDVKKADAPEIVLPVHEISSASALDLRQTASPPQAVQPTPATPARSLAIQDVQPILPEIPKPPASTEILLQLAGQNQSSASVRVVDRMGTINVTVHAADADLRSSLRSNLSDLASQLTGQGYKTEMVKPAVLAANADNQHDSRQNGRDASGQQQQHQSTPDGRQPQRDRRANSERWLDQLEQETSGAPGAPGGKS
jgi:hypothetical protein